MKPTMFIKKGCPILIQVEDLSDRRYFGCSEREAIRQYREEFGLKGLHFRKVYTTLSAFGYLN